MTKNIVIESWMTSKLKLNGNALVLFAILWRDSKKGEVEVVDDYQSHSAAMGVTVPTYYNAVKKLMEQGIVCKAATGKMFRIDVKRAAA